MSEKVKKIFKYSLFIIIPLLCVFLSVLFKIAQGEKNEEIVAGVMLGIALDLIYSIYLLVINKNSKTNRKRNKIITLIVFSCIVVVIIGFLFSSAFISFTDDRTNEYKARYFSNKDSLIIISESITQHYESNDLQGEVSIWCSENDTEIFYGSSIDVEPQQYIKQPFEQSELDEIYNFMHNSRYEYVSINGEFIEFGNSAGSISMYLCLTDEKPEKISKNHKMYDFGEGWYFSISITR